MHCIQPLKFFSPLMVITAKAHRTLVRADVSSALHRHFRGDWGDVCDEDRQINNQALFTRSRLLSVYHDRYETTFWIITDADRSVTTVLLPEDY